jgi:hypothetical protein
MRLRVLRPENALAIERKAVFSMLLLFDDFRGVVLVPLLPVSNAS